MPLLYFTKLHFYYTTGIFKHILKITETDK